MYIRTPKKYRGAQRRSVFPFKRFLFVLVLLGLIGAGVGIYQNREMLRPMVDEVVGTFSADLGVRMATMNAPTPTATQDPRNNLIQADNFWSRGSVQEAIPLYVSILDAVPNDSATYVRTALGLIAQGELVNALDVAERSVTADPFSSDAWAARGWALDWNGRYGEAIASLLQARDLDANNSRVFAWLAEAYFSNGQTERALNTANQAIEMDPNSAEGYRARGIIRWQGTFEFESAMSDFQQAYNLAQGENPAIANLVAIDIANLEIRNGNTEAAKSTLEGILDTNPQNTQAIYSLGTIYFRNDGAYEQAYNLFLRCVDFSPESVGCNYMLGRSQERLDQLQSAAESFAKAIELGSSDPQHYWWAGRSQISLGNCVTALTYLRDGYQIALRTNRFVEDYESIIPLCDPSFGPSQPEETPEPEVPDDPENTA